MKFLKHMSPKRVHLLKLLQSIMHMDSKSRLYIFLRCSFILIFLLTIIYLIYYHHIIYLLWCLSQKDSELKINDCLLQTNLISVCSLSLKALISYFSLDKYFDLINQNDEQSEAMGKEWFFLLSNIEKSSRKCSRVHLYFLIHVSLSVVSYALQHDKWSCIIQNVKDYTNFNVLVMQK